MKNDIVGYETSTAPVCADCFNEEIHSPTDAITESSLTKIYNGSFHCSVCKKKITL